MAGPLPPAPPSWFVANATAVIAGVFGLFTTALSSLTAFLSSRNSKKLTEITVKTDGRFDAMATRLDETHAAALIAAENAREAARIAGDKSTKDAVDAALRGVEAVPGIAPPPVVVLEAKLKGTIEGKVDKSGVLKAETEGVIRPKGAE